MGMLTRCAGYATLVRDLGWVFQQKEGMNTSETQGKELRATALGLAQDLADIVTLLGMNGSIGSPVFNGRQLLDIIEGGMVNAQTKKQRVFTEEERAKAERRMDHSHP